MESIQYYGQFGEDKIMASFFDDAYKGTCIDVGASDGIFGNNTYYFEKKGWKTLCIEPIPESFDKCSKIRNNCINCCISDVDKDDEQFIIFKLNDNNTDAISSLKPDIRLISSHSHLIKESTQIKVKCKRLTTVLNEIQFDKIIDFISIDTENTELDVLKGIDFDTYFVKYLLIENNFEDNEIEDYLKTKGFIKFKRNVVNDFYVNQLLLDSSK